MLRHRVPCPQPFSCWVSGKEVVEVDIDTATIVNLGRLDLPERSWLAEHSARFQQIYRRGTASGNRLPRDLHLVVSRLTVKQLIAQSSCYPGNQAIFIQYAYFCIRRRWCVCRKVGAVK